MESSAAGPSNSIESSNSGPSTSSNGGPAAFDSSRSEPEPGQKVDVQVISLLSRLKSPRPSDFAQNVLYVFVIVKKGTLLQKKTKKKKRA